MRECPLRPCAGRESAPLAMAEDDGRRSCCQPDARADARASIPQHWNLAAIVPNGASIAMAASAAESFPAGAVGQ